MPSLHTIGHPFADHLGLRFTGHGEGSSRCALEVGEVHLNPHGVVHGAVIFALADTGMGAALYPTLGEGESCATIEIKINFFRPVSGGALECTSTLVNRGRTVANLESRITREGVLVAVANGNFAVFAQRRPTAEGPPIA